MRKGDIFVYPRALDPYKKYYVEEVYENEVGETMAIVSWEDPKKDTGWDSSCNLTRLYMEGHKRGHIKFIGNEIDGIPRVIKQHSFNPTPRCLPFIRKWGRGINPYEKPHLFTWTNQ